MVKVGIVLIAAAVLAGYAAVTTTQHVLSCVPLPMQSVAHPTQVAMESAVNAVRPRKSPVSDLHVFWDMAVDTANTFRAVLAWSAAYGDMVLAAAVGRDSLCLVDGLGMGGGAHVTENAAERWNSALQRLRPGLLLSNPALVQRAAIAALGFSTGIYSGLRGGRLRARRAMAVHGGGAARVSGLGERPLGKSSLERDRDRAQFRATHLLRAGAAGWAHRDHLHAGSPRPPLIASVDQARVRPDPREPVQVIWASHGKLPYRV